MRPELAGLGEDLATEALWLGVAVLVAGGVAVVIPAVHAATVRLAAQMAKASTAERSLLIDVL